MPELLMLLMKSVVMGIVEGITEFLPISSTGHLIVTRDLVGFPRVFGDKVFEVVIQLGAILAVMWYYRKKISESIKTLADGRQGFGFRLWFNMLVAFLPAAVLGFLGNDFIEEKLFSPTVVAWAMMAGAVLLYIVQRVSVNSRLENLEDATWKKSLFIGFFQCLSLIPGMSRSGSTIMGGMLAGFNAKGAAEFSFFLAMPTMLAASGYKMLKGFGVLGATEWISLLVGFVVSFIVALVVVDKFLSFLSKRSLDVFVYYRLIAGAVLLGLIHWGWIGG